MSTATYPSPGRALMDALRDAAVRPIPCTITTLRATATFYPDVYQDVRILHPFDRETQAMSTVDGQTIYATVDDDGRSGFATLLDFDFDAGTVNVVAGPVPVLRRGTRALAAFAVPEGDHGHLWFHFTTAAELDAPGNFDVALFPHLPPAAPESPVHGNSFVLPAVVINNHVGDKG